MDCENPLSAGQGPTAARRYDYTAREVAWALSALAQGATYEQAALTARDRRPAAQRRGSRLVGDAVVPVAEDASRHPLGNWVETFTDVVLARDELTEWSGALLLDSTSFWRRVGGGRGAPAFSVLFAYGYPGGPLSGQLMMAQAYKSGNTAAWVDMLSQPPGRPEVVVADRGQAILAAVPQAGPGVPAQPGPEQVACRWHLAKNLREVLAEDYARINPPPLGVPKSRHTAGCYLWPVIERAFDSWTSWETFRSEAHHSRAGERRPERETADDCELAA